ncbi:MAG: DNA-3-methyladenine glycosylase [Acidobacteriota bacterium]
MPASLFAIAQGLVLSIMASRDTLRRTAFSQGGSRPLARRFKRSVTELQPLSRSFYTRPAPVVARALLGKRLVHGGRAGRIVETEAYLGQQDRASHARFGRTERNEMMYRRGGMVYVYLVYGIHHMFNVVSGPEGRPEAILIRALEALTGDDRSPAVARGPGKLTRFLDLTLRHDGVDLTHGDRIFIADGRRRPGESIGVSQRIGVRYAGSWARAPLRFFLVGHPAVSGDSSLRDLDS